MALGPEWIGYVGATLTTGALVPQLLKAFKTKKTRDISLWYFLVLLTGVGLWIVYGTLDWNGPILYANWVAFFLILGILFAKYKYG